MLLLLQLILLFLFFGVTGCLVSTLIPGVRHLFRSAVDRSLFSLFFGMGLYILLFILLNALFRVPVNRLTILGSFLVLTLFSYGYLRIKGIQLTLSFQKRELLILLLVVILFVLALKVRLINTLYYPDHLVDSDPYRHYIRSKALLQSGMLSKWEPHIIGNVPILFMQGCYIFATLASLVSGIDLWYIWKYGSIIMGVLGILSFYLFVKYSFRRNTALALAASGFLALSPIHIFRTDIGFSEPYALLFIPLTFLFLLRFVKEGRYSDAFLFGIFFTAAAANNLLVGAMTTPLLLVYGFYVILINREKRIIVGFAGAFAVFAFFLLLWSRTYLGVPLLQGGSALSSETVELVNSERPEITLLPFLFNWIGAGTMVPALLGLFVFLCLPSFLTELGNGSARHGIIPAREKVFFIIYFFLYFFLAYLAHRGSVVIPAARVYRYITLSSFCLSLFAAIGCIGCIEGVHRVFLSRTWRSHMARNAGYGVIAVLLTVSIYSSRPKTFWLMGPTVEEFSACEWIRDHMEEDAIIVAHWYTGDFIRSLTDRSIAISPRHRTQVAEEIERTDVRVPVLENPEDMVRFSGERPEPVYFFKSQYGPWFDVDSTIHFLKVYETESPSKKPVSIYSIRKTFPEDS